MGKILTPAGSGKVPVGFPIALTAEEGDDISNLSAPDTSAVSSQKSSESVAPSKPVPSKPTSTKQQPPSPAVSHLLSNYVIKDVADIPATGPRGRLLKGDVLAYIATKNIPRAQQSAPTPKAAPKETLQPSSGYTDIPTTSMRRIIAQRLGESKSTVPHSYTSRDISMGAVNKLRQTLKNEYDIKVSVNDFVIRACALALRDVPEANVRYNPKLDDGVEKVKDIDISVAVATPTGLITPIVKNADQKGLKIISAEIKDLAARAKINKLKPNEYQGGSFSISNLGMLGIKHFTAIINPPQACILAVSAGHDVLTPVSPSNNPLDELMGLGQPEVISALSQPPTTSTITPSQSADILDELMAPSPKKGANLPSSIQIQNIMTVTLSSDERVVDGQIAAQLLNRVEHYLSSPQNMIL
ncbi:hypothetical protein DSO57_1029328 [Entomophthora muscae]|uniref:Uncharacterized protein n=1 Tax=Entomophthora muscae TaxID=34485 RepID=A0ACC2T1G2_9FUNG|nr:hypothetical protein DSO57_1029328 [Entomophthora muscae]